MRSAGSRRDVQMKIFYVFLERAIAKNVYCFCFLVWVWVRKSVCGLWNMSGQGASVGNIHIVMNVNNRN